MSVEEVEAAFEIEETEQEEEISVLTKCHYLSREIENKVDICS